MHAKAWPGRLVAWQTVGFAVASIAVLNTSAVPAGAVDQMPVTVVIARQGPVTEQIAVVGTLAAREEIQVHPSAQGREIKQMLVEVGQRVEAGQPLVLLDAADTLLALDKNAVNMQRAKVAIAAEKSKVDIALVSEREASKRLERSRSLQPKGAVSNQVLEEHQNAHDRAVAELALARQSLALAEADAQIITSERREIELTLERCTLRAPLAGIILDRSARIGAVTSSAGEPLFVIARDGAIEFVAEVTDANFVRLKEGMTARITVPGLDAPVPGTVRLSAARLDPKTRSGSVRIDLDGDDGLVPGAFARGAVDTARRSNVLLPGTAVKSAGGVSSVYVVRNDLVSVRNVAVGARRDNLVEIVEGVSDGEMVVVKAGGFLKDRDRVTPILASVDGVAQRELSEVVAPADRGKGVRR
jgi:HlyD family secretion protein